MDEIELSLDNVSCFVRSSLSLCRVLDFSLHTLIFYVLTPFRLYFHDSDIGYEDHQLPLR